eukprot:gene23516-biopygen10353
MPPRPSIFFGAHALHRGAGLLAHPLRAGVALGGHRTLARAWRGHGAGVARAYRHFFGLGGAGVARACSVTPGCPSKLPAEVPNVCPGSRRGHPQIPKLLKKCTRRGMLDSSWGGVAELSNACPGTRRGTTATSKIAQKCTPAAGCLTSSGGSVGKPSAPPAIQWMSCENNLKFGEVRGKRRFAPQPRRGWQRCHFAKRRVHGGI